MWPRLTRRTTKPRRYLHRMVRGTGLAGLAGIPTTRRLSQLTTIVRPLLSVRRSRVRDYLADLHQPYREDSSNRLLTFTRNRIRHGLLPQLASDYNPQVSQALIRLGQLAREAQEVITTLVNSLVERCLMDCSPDCVRLDRFFVVPTRTISHPRADEGNLAATTLAATGYGRREMAATWPYAAT